ncbi:Gfo/Idh/MocA family oxidoreductase [Prosthecobacter sp.]|uniref:Gfo/Idh/MocA family protein n=1 Tax=Prosthecobacter sp. TaxID=1965333 RepID=UPI001D7AF258|nr:Gfo/Idh/MocA family oxidoreductase [Prosthecobacter sp.]MCB1274987.1 Gfo/Idh/MocA family oxidoreductase [Prosthecobacter sp.]
MIRQLLLVVSALTLFSLNASAQNIRAGIIGLDTSHALAFTKTLNATPQKPEVMGVRLVAAYPQGSKDIESSTKRVPEYTEKIKELGVEIVPSIDALLDKVDVVFLESNDGRVHLEQLLPCIEAHKPVFIDKPIAGTLVDAIKIFDASKAASIPVFSSSSLRFGKGTQEVRGGSIGLAKEAETTSPASLEEHHPDLFWYGIHGVESLFTVMGTGCESVKRGTTAEGKITVTGTWKGGRKGTYTESKGYGGKAIGEKGEAAVGTYDGYDPLLYSVVHFFRTGVAPVSPEETIEIYAFMEAADESKRRDGAEVTIKEVMDKALAEARK